MANLENQKVRQIASPQAKKTDMPKFITEDVVEVQRAKLVYYKWISRLMAVLAAISIIVNVCTTLSIMKLAPEIVIDPQIFVHMSDSPSIVKREYVNRRMESREKMMVNFIKQYVEIRNSFILDSKEMVNRWSWGGLISYLSTYKVYSEFAEKTERIKHELNAIKGSRSVEILSVERTGGERSNTWKVEFKTYDFSYGSEDKNRKESVEPNIKERFWTANIRGYVDSNRRISFRRLINPLGFVIYSYFQSEIEI